MNNEVEPLTSGSTVTFNDVQGVDEAKHELEEIVAFLKEPSKFMELGGKLPKGILLYGPPGTGKTHLVIIINERLVPLLEKLEFRFSKCRAVNLMSCMLV